MEILDKYKATIHKISNAFIALVLLMVLFPGATSAAALTSLSDTMSRLKISTVSDHTIKYTTPTGVAAAGTMTVTMPAGFTIGTVDFTDIDVSWGPTTGYENELILAATPSVATWGAAFAGQVLTITSGTGTITATNKVVVEIGLNATAGVAGDAQITNNSSAATYTISIAGTFGDTGKVAVVITADDSIVYSATVDPTITMTFSANTSSLGTLSVSSVSSSTAITLTISTNGESGATVTLYDGGDTTNPGLYKSSSPTDLIGSATAAYADGPTALVAGTEGYGIQAKTSASGTGGTFTVGTRYNNDYDVNNTVGGLEVGSGAAQTLATASVPINQREILMKAKAAIDGLNRAGSYQDTVTVIATGNF